MDHSSLGRASAVITSVCFPYVWQDNAPTTGDTRRWEAAQALAAGLKPFFYARPALLEEARAAIEEPSDTTLASLGDALARLFRQEPDLAERVRSILEHSPFAQLLVDIMADEAPNQLGYQAELLREQIQDDITSHPLTREKAAEENPITACRVCGRQDASLRVVVFPYIVSFIFLTQRRVFVGLWCRQHAAIRQLLAAAITASIGWLGIPFGLLWTPLALWKLAMGGDQPEEKNRQMLTDLGEHLLKMGDAQEAIRCYEAALEFGNTPEVRDRLKTLYQANPPTAHFSAGRQIVWFLAVLAAGYLLGLSVGVLDHVIAVNMSPVFEASSSLILAMLSWAPLVAPAAIAGIALTWLTSAALRHSQTYQQLLGAGLAVVAALATAYGIPAAEALADTVTSGALSETFPTLLSVIVILSWAFTRGAVVVLQNYYASGTTAANIYLLIILAAAGFYLAANLSAVSKVIREQRRLRSLRPAASGSALQGMPAGWLSLFSGGFAFIVMLLVSFIPAYADPNEAAYDRTVEGMALLEKGEREEARQVFEDARSEYPDSLLPYWGLANYDMSTGNCPAAEEHLEQAQALAPQDYAFIYAQLGTVYTCTDQINEAIEALEYSLSLDPAYNPAIHLQLGGLYSTKADRVAAQTHFQSFAEAQPDSATPYALLAGLYYEMDEGDRQAQALQQALAHPLDEELELVALAGYYSYINDFARALELLEQAEEISPDSYLIRWGLADTSIWLRDYERAAQIANDLITELPYDADSYVLKSGIAIEQEDLNAAGTVVDQGLRLNPDDADLIAQRAFIQYAGRDYGGAIDSARHSIRLNPYHASAYRTLALAYQAQGALESARYAAQQSIWLEPKGDVAYYVLGVYYLEAGYEAAAAASFKTFLALTWDRAYIRTLAFQAELYLAEMGE